MSDGAKAVINIALTTIIFSTMEVAIKLTGGVFSAMQITAVRFFIGGAFMLPFAALSLKSKGVHLEKRDFFYMAFTGFICIPISMVCYQLALILTKASVVAVIFSGNSIFLVPLAAVMFKEPMRKNNVLALICIIFGIFFIADPLHTTLNLAGVALVVVAALTFAVYSLFNRSLTRKYSGMVTISGNFLWGSLELMLMVALAHLQPVANFFNSIGLETMCGVSLTANLIGSATPMLLYISVIGTGIGYLCHQLSLRYADAKTAGLIFFFKPALAPLIALAVLGEEITSNMAAGIACFLIGSLIGLVPDLIRSHKAKQAAKTA